MAAPSVTYTFTNGTTADASQVSQNFTDLINAMTDGTKTFAISALTLASTFTVNANVVLGASSANTITVTGSIASAIPFSANTSWDLGGATLGAKSLYLGGSSTYTVRVLAATMSASYTLTLPPAVPALSGSVLQMDTSGAVTVTANPSVTTITTSANAIVAGNAVVTGVVQGTTIQVGGGPILSNSAGQLLGNFTQFFPNGTSQAGFEVINTKTIAVRSSGAISDDIVTSPHPSTNGLRIVRGTFHWSGSAMVTDSGEGFTLSRTSQGKYAVTFNSSFADVPSITVSTIAVSSPSYDSPLAGSFNFIHANQGSDALLSSGCSFTAVGQRNA